MKVILKAEVDNLGLPGDVVDVADGYGRNFLIPRGKAIRATAGAMKEAEAITRSRKAQEAKTFDSAQAVAEEMEARTLRIPVRVDDLGHLYGSVSVTDVQRVLKERGHKIEKKRIDLSKSIKQIGTYEIPVQVHPQVTATITVDVVDQEGVVTVESLGKAEPPPPPLLTEEGEEAAETAETAEEAEVPEGEAAGQAAAEAAAAQAAEETSTAPAEGKPSIEERALEAAEEFEANEESAIDAVIDEDQDADEA